MNLYAYVGNDPINRFDPSGTDACIEWDTVRDYVITREDTGQQVRGRRTFTHRVCFMDMAFDWIGLRDGFNDGPGSDPCGGGEARDMLVPDYIELQTNYGTTPPGSPVPVGAGGQLTITRYGDIYSGGNGGVQPPGPGIAVTGGWVYVVPGGQRITQQPTRGEINQFIGGSSYQASGGAAGRVAGAAANENGLGLQVGVGTPGVQAGVSENTQEPIARIPICIIG